MNKNVRLAFFSLLVLLLVIIISTVWIGQNPTAADWRSYAVQYQNTINDHYVFSVICYIIGYALIVVTGVPLFVPAMLIAGYLFGGFYGLLYAVIAANVGAISSFLLVRWLFHSLLISRYEEKLAVFKQKMTKYSCFYMLFLHLSMIFPYALINTLAALSDVPLVTFIWTTIVGSFPFIAFNVFAGAQLQHMAHSPQAGVSGLLLLCGAIIIGMFLIPVVVRLCRREEHLL
jgi:uncharacterized membrane protein YdjX (TVP38/TMEM64 family)